MTDEQRDLDNLLKHPGWLRAVEQGKRELEDRLSTAINNAANERNDVMALNLLRQVIAARQALETFIAWPASRLKVLQNAPTHAAAPQLSRRGDL